MDEHLPARGNGACCGEDDAVRHVLRYAREQMPQTALDISDVGAMVREMGSDAALLHAAVRITRTRSFTELITLIREAVRSAAQGEPVADGPVKAIVDLAEESMASAPEKSRRAWTALSVLDHSYTRGLAEEVLRAADVSHPEEALAELVTAGVVERREEDAELRFRMRTVYLAPGKQSLARSPRLFAAARSGLLAWWSSTAQEFQDHWFGAGEAERFDRVEAELPSLELLLDTTHPGDGGRLVAIVASLWPLWTARGRVEAAGGWVTTAIDHGQSDPDVLFDALWAVAWLALCASDVERADRALAAARPVSSRQEMRLRQITGIRELYVGDALSSRLALQAALEHDVEHAGPADVFIDLSYLAASAWYSDDQAAATEHFTRAEQLSDAHDEKWIRTYATWVGALVAWRAGDRALAYERALECTNVAAAHGDRHAAALALEILAWHQATEGHHRQAARLLGVVRALEAIAGIPTLYWETQSVHQEAVETIVAQIGTAEYEQLLHESRLHGVTDAIAWLEAKTSSPQPIDAGATAAKLLTPRQLEVAVLVADGLTNKEIARRLMVTVRAVEAHVERIFTRLGYVSRAQVAAWVARQGNVHGN